MGGETGVTKSRQLFGVVLLEEFWRNGMIAGGAFMLSREEF